MLNLSNDVNPLQTYYYCAALSETVIFESRARKSGRRKTNTSHGNEKWGRGPEKTDRQNIVTKNISQLNMI